MPRGLDIEQDLRYQRRSWRWQRVGWGLMALVVAAALVGLLGPGPLSRGRAEAEGLAVEYQRCVRDGAPMVLRLYVRSGGDGRARVRLATNYLQSMRLLQVSPHPVAIEAAGRDFTYVFGVSSGETVTIKFDLEPQGPGLRLAAVGLSGAGEARFRQLVFP